MTKDTDKLLIAISATANHGKTTTGKQLIRNMASDQAFNGRYSNYRVWKLGKRKTAIPDLLKDGTGDWVAFYYDTEDCANPIVAVVTGGDGWSSELEAVYKHVFSSDSIKIVVGACRPNNNVHTHLLDYAKEKHFLMVETSPIYVSHNNRRNDAEAGTLYQEWTAKCADELKEIIKDRLGLAVSASC